jgi:hypothetical protein
LEYSKEGGIDMREKQYTHAITFFANVDMYRTIKNISDERKVSLSVILRTALSKFIEAEGYLEKENSQTK